MSVLSSGESALCPAMSGDVRSVQGGSFEHALNFPMHKTKMSV